MEDECKVAIIGVAFRFPGAATVHEYWNNLLNGVVSISRRPPEDDRDNFVPWYGSITDRDRFDHAFFNISRREAELMDPQQRLLLECGWTLQQVIGPDSTSGYVTGVYIGTTISTYLHNCMAAPLVPNSHQGFEVMLACDKDYSAARMSYKLGFTGPSIAVQTGCSSSLVAVHLACQSILTGESDVAFAGGACVQWVPHHGHYYVPGHVYSPDGMCRPFDEQAAGTAFSDGVGLVALKRLDLALQDGDDIHAVIRGTATNNSGATGVGFTAPSYQAQTILLKQAYANAQVDPGTVGFVETHGAGTRLGDPIEFNALAEVFNRARAGSCALGAVKSNIGHLASAAGIAGLIKAALCLREGCIPPHPLFNRPSPDIKLNQSPFYINTRPTEWKTLGTRFAAVSSFGVGGSNAHVVLESAPERAPAPVADGPCRVLLSAPTLELLQEHCRDLAAHLTVFPDIRLADVAHTLTNRRRVLSCARVVVAASREELIACLRDGPASMQAVVPGEGGSRDAVGGRIVALPVPRLNGPSLAVAADAAASPRPAARLADAGPPSRANSVIEVMERQLQLMRSQLRHLTAVRR
ncbi:polyketide synthase (plasmid) [Azospirillum argentinense]|uniref:Polyketide synthase n=1 Tax=Azospirillum argentinense TaxID=2970906 RepID=A0A4D8PXV4_9PROT|nr:polyketide synthase [Azospirillum argentinense]QCO00276.1 polyketide synthase [Azospirillum argentinense]